jgi:hypothetical protein
MSVTVKAHKVTGGRNQPVSITVNRPHTADGEPSGDIYLFIETGKRSTMFSINPAYWDRLNNEVTEPKGRTSASSTS